MKLNLGQMMKTNGFIDYTGDNKLIGDPDDAAY